MGRTTATTAAAQTAINNLFTGNGQRHPGEQLPGVVLVASGNGSPSGTQYLPHLDQLPGGALGLPVLPPERDPHGADDDLTRDAQRTKGENQHAGTTLGVVPSAWLANDKRPPGHRR
ncbi:MAG: hypothetical protein IPH72_26605 [Sandaracinaceae bacterium]|nr:hypothetical protein [Sandaracinaceae bacterium]